MPHDDKMTDAARYNFYLREGGIVDQTPQEAAVVSLQSAESPQTRWLQVRYFIAVDDEEVISDLYHNRITAGHPTQESAEARLATYDDEMRPHFKVYRVEIRPVNGDAQ